MTLSTEILGHGIRFPMIRVGSDFQTSSGPDLVFSSVPWLLMTQSSGPGVQGEIPWDSSFGSQIHRLKHKNIITDQEALNELARQYIIDGLAVNEPRLLVTNVEVEFMQNANGNSLDISITAATIEEDVDANDVRIQNETKMVFSLPI